MINRPKVYQQHRRLLRYWRPKGSNLLVVVRKGLYGPAYSLLQWGDRLYLPVETGDEPVIYVHNYNRHWVAVPAYMEGANVFDGGNAHPQLCSPDEMWEAKPYVGRAVIRGLHDPRSNRTRPFRITRSGDGLTIGEARFGTTRFRGQFYAYERWQQGYGSPPDRRWNQGWSQGVGAGLYRHPRAPVPGPRPLSAGAQGGLEAMRDSGAKGSSPQAESMASAGRGHRDRDEGRAGVGLGAAEQQLSHETGIQYGRVAMPLYRLYVEFRVDLQREFGYPGWNWSWRWPDWSTPWWENPWNWGGVADDIPTTPPQPHRPR